MVGVRGCERFMPGDGCLINGVETGGLESRCLVGSRSGALSGVVWMI